MSKFNSEAMAQALSRISAEETQRKRMLEDIIQWLLNKGF
ncbi:hypothetical protein JOD02_000167 [Caldicoprobacter guelmensis]|nr:hypothetical protein [Caldicoprobacter guelmensis]